MQVGASCVTGHKSSPNDDDYIEYCYINWANERMEKANLQKYESDNCKMGSRDDAQTSLTARKERREDQRPTSGAPGVTTGTRTRGFE